MTAFDQIKPNIRPMQLIRRNVRQKTPIEGLTKWNLPPYFSAVLVSVNGYYMSFVSLVGLTPK
jgi:hypothetical protein